MTHGREAEQPVAWLLYRSSSPQGATERMFGLLVAAMVTGAFGAPPDQALADLVGGAAGNPSLLAELIGGLGDEHGVRIAGGRAVLACDRLPARVRRVAQQRLDGLSRQARQLLVTAAVLGATFRLDDAAEMLGESPATLLPAVQEAMDAAVITAAEDTFVFRHQLRAGSHLLCSAYPGDSASLAGLDHAAEQTLRSAPQTAELQALAGLRDPLAGLAAGAVLATPGRPGSPATTAALVTRASVAWDHGRDQARVRRRLRHLGIRRRHWATTAAARPVTGWDSLTGTEQAVARLVAEGLNNGQVAARMYISPHTVAHHLRQAFRKLTISSRVELTRIVIEHAADDADLAERNHKQGGPR
jgi:DNA-binding CsgD family transcriptional regulator